MACLRGLLEGDGSLTTIGDQLIGPSHTLEYAGRNITVTWFDAPFFAAPPRVYAVCFASDGRIVLARSSHDSLLYLPGGGVESGETMDAALVRELREEICAELLRHTYIGCHRVDDPDDPDAPRSVFHMYYSCHVRLDEFVPEVAVSERYTVVERVLVQPEEFMGAIAWSDNPASRIILDRALAARPERQYGRATERVFVRSGRGSQCN